jgi:hypothetical protein
MFKRTTFVINRLPPSVLAGVKGDIGEVVDMIERGIG